MRKRRRMGWARAKRRKDCCRNAPYLVYKKRGNIEGLSKYLGHRLGPEPGFFRRCMKHEKLAGYEKDVRAAICAKAHKIWVGIWPGEHGGENPKGPG